MIYKGYKIKVRCIDWEQVKVLDRYWSIITKYVDSKDIIGLGMNWTDDYLYFEYALGVIDNEKVLDKLKTIDFSNTEFNVKYVEMNLPNLNEWESFTGKEKDIKRIYEDEIDCYNRPYDYELEYIDNGNIEVKIHFLDS